jgi:pimeloyl-ACP methyl ester carboxylesterase
MIPCFAVDEIVTPKGYELRGLWFGPKRPKRAIVWVHGLGGNAFTRMRVAAGLTDGKTAVLTFSNRGHDDVSRIYNTKGKALLAGTAHEKFTDSADDIEGAINFVRKQGVKEIYLVGHSTGCQKSIYWAYKKKGRGVKGIVLLAPLSDYASALGQYGKVKLEQTVKIAQALIARGKPHELMPDWMWDETHDAQRFLSLYTPDSVEEIFSYAQPQKNPRILKQVKKPMLVLLAEKDEFSDRPAREIAIWFEKNIKAPHQIQIVPHVSHSFKGAEKRVASSIRAFIQS